MYQSLNAKNFFSNDQESFHHFYNTNTQTVCNDNEFNEFLEAARLGELSGIKSYLHNHQYNIDGCDSIGWTALMYAASYGHYNIIKSLLELGANSNLKEFQVGRTALMMAASNGHTRCIEMLVQGKADIRIKDINNCTAAYYATHYGHGSNKIIARLLRIPGNSTQYSSNNYNNSMNSSLTSNKHYNGHNGLSNDSQNSFISNNDRYNQMILNHRKNSLNDDSEFSQYNSFNTSGDHYLNDERRYSIDGQTNQLSNSFISSTNQSIHDILKRTQPKPRALFKQRPRRNSPISHQLIQEINQNNNSLNKESMITNQINFNHMANKPTARYSFGCVNQMMQNFETPQKNNLRTNSLSLDLNGQRNLASPNGFSPDQTFSSLPGGKSQQSFFQYDSVFESPQSSTSDQQSCTEKLQQSKLESSFYNLNISWNDPNENSNDNNEICETSNKRNKPRNSTFVSCVSSIDQSAQQIDQSNDSTVPVNSEKSTSNLDEITNKFAGLVTNLEEFLQQENLVDLIEIFVKQNIGLYGFLLLSETDFKQLGITNPEYLATLIAGQLKFKETIGIKSLESMDFICYLGDQLDKTRKELEITKKQCELHKMNLYDVK